METLKKDSLSDKLESALFPVLFLVSMMSLFFGVVHTVIPGFWNELCAVVFLNLVCVFCIKGQEKIGILSIHLFSSLLLLYISKDLNSLFIESGFFGSIARISLIVCLFYFMYRLQESNFSLKSISKNMPYLTTRLIVIVLFYGVFTNFGSNFIWMFSIPLSCFLVIYIDEIYIKDEEEWLWVTIFLSLPVVLSSISFWYQYWFQELIFGLLGWHIFVGLIVLFTVALANVLRKI